MSFNAPSVLPLRQPVQAQELGPSVAAPVSHLFCRHREGQADGEREARGAREARDFLKEGTLVSLS